MELRHLRYLDAVVREGSFTRAAATLGVAQPPLSRQIRDLEEELGIVLFDREVRPVRLTEAGRLVHEQVARILSGVEQLRHAARQFARAGRQRFVVGFAASVIYGDMPQLVRRFRAGAPQVDVQLVEMTTLEQVAALKDGRIDAGLGRIRIDDPAVHRAILHEEAIVAALPAGHKLALRGSPVTLAELAAETVILYPNAPRPSYADQMLAHFRDCGCVPTMVQEVREVQAALGLVAAQSGIALVPRSMRAVQRDDIVYRPLADAGVSSPIILSRRMADSSATITLFEGLAFAVYKP